MIQNLVWATGYNLVAIPVAAGLLVPWGIDLPMAVGAIAMSASTIIVAANAQLLRRVPTPCAEPARSTLYRCRTGRLRPHAPSRSSGPGRQRVMDAVTPWKHLAEHKDQRA